MSRHFGEIRQLGYVVPDIEAALDSWSRTLGVSVASSVGSATRCSAR